MRVLADGPPAERSRIPADRARYTDEKSAFVQRIRRQASRPHAPGRPGEPLTHMEEKSGWSSI